MTVLWVAAGGAIGASLRYLVGRGADRFGAEGFWGTAVVNVLGAFVLGFVLMAFAPEDDQQRRWFLFLTTGVLGGFTTFSTWMAESAALWTDGRAWVAVANLAIPLVAGLVGMAAGITLGARV